MVDIAPPLNLECLLNALYVIASYLTICPQAHLHLTAPLEPIDELRLYDFAQRYHLDLTCLIQIFRSVYAAQHAAYHYNTWTVKHGSDDLEEFCASVFGARPDPCTVGRMITDGRRLLELENACRNSYMCFVVALDWRRFEVTPDATLSQLTRDLLSKPAVQGLMTSLGPQWMYASFHDYHEQLLAFRLGSVQDRQRFLDESVHRCSGCSLFLQQSSYDQTHCVGCRRGGFICRGSLQTAIEPQLLNYTTGVLRRVLKNSNHLSCTLFGEGRKKADPLPKPVENAAGSQAVESLMLGITLEIDRVLEDLCQFDTLACEACRRRKIRCSLKAVQNSAHQRCTRKAFQTLPPLLESEEDLREKVSRANPP